MYRFSPTVDVNIRIFYSWIGDSTYLTQAESNLSALLSPDYYLLDTTDGYQFILRRSTAKWGESERGAVFGDYFFLEAMVTVRISLYECIALSSYTDF